MKRFGFIVLLSACGSDGRGVRDASVDTAPDVRVDVAPPEPARTASRYVEPRRSILTNDQVGRLAIPFQENDGQWPDDVAFKADHFAGSLWVTRDGSIVYSLLGPQVDDAEQESLHLGSSLSAPNAVTDPFGLHRAPSSLVEVVDPSSTPINFAVERDLHNPFERNHEPPNRGPGWTLVEHFVHGHPRTPRGLDPAVTNVSYFIGNDESKWAPHVATFGALTLGEVWPGIEVRLVARGNNVEKFFHVRPHRDPSLIEMRLEGSEPLRLSDDGAMIVTTGNGEVELSPPLAFQVIQGERREVEVRYELVTSDSYRFILGDYDRGYEVVVDPILQSTYLGGSNSEQYPSRVIIDGAGHILVAGYTLSSNYPGTAGGAQPFLSGVAADMMISRLDSSLTALLQSTYLGGSGFDQASDLALDPAGNVFVTGLSASTDFPGTAGGFRSTNSGAQDIVVLRLDGSLTALVRSTYLGSAGSDQDGGIAVDGGGNVIVCGSAQGGYPGVLGGAQSVYGGAGSPDIVLSRLTPDLTTLLQSTYLGGSSSDGTAGFAIDATSGDVLVAGYSASSNFPGVAGGAQPILGGPNGTVDIVLARLNGSLTALLQSTYLGGTGNDGCFGGIRIDAVGNVLVAGYSGSSDYPGTSGGAQAMLRGSQDIVISRFNGSLTVLLQSTYLGGTSTDATYGDFALDSTGNVLVSGRSNSEDYPGVMNAAQGTYGGGGLDMVLSLLTGDLTSLQQSTFLGGSLTDDPYPTGITVDGSGAVLVSGYSNSTNFPGTAGGAQPNTGGNFDIVLSRLSGDLLGCSDNSGCITVPGGSPIFTARPICNVATRRCVQCATNADCEDGNLCTTNTCNVGTATCATTNVLAGTTCRASAGACDIAETCLGGGAPCPLDAVRANGFGCRASSGTCDLAELCDGVTATCPADTNYAPNTIECRGAVGDCDLAENCTGSSNSCPPDTKRNGFECRASAGVCDVAEVCNGSSNTCPADAFRNTSFECRLASGECDAAEFCGGNASSCPSDTFDPSGTNCSGGVCDGANLCVECVQNADCEDGNPCTVNTCSGNSCSAMNGSAGTPCGVGLSCDGSGSCVGCTLPSQCGDGNECTDDLCTAGICSNPSLAEATGCSTGVCEVSGVPSCVQCVSDAHCSGTTPLCLPFNNTCVSCADPNVASLNVTCPPNTMCNRTSGACVPAAACDDDGDCPSPTPTCDPNTRLCIGCGDGQVMCQNGDLCDPDTGRCGLDPTQDADNDGINNGIECAALRNCPDTDGDMMADYLDPDDDGDSVLTATECPNPSMCLDTDGDGTSNYLDPDDDGDGISTLDEVTDGLVHGSDIDLDGVPNYLSTDSDRDGSSDRIEGRNNSPNGVPAYLDVNFLGGGGIAGGALRCSVGTQGRDTPIALFAFCTMALGFVRRRHLM